MKLTLQKTMHFLITYPDRLYLVSLDYNIERLNVKCFSVVLFHLKKLYDEIIVYEDSSFVIHSSFQQLCTILMYAVTNKTKLH